MGTMTMKRLLLIALLLLVPALASAQVPTDATVVLTYDPALTNGYVPVVEGARAITTTYDGVIPVADDQVPSPTPANVKVGWDHDGYNADGYALIVDDVRSVIVATCTGVAPALVCTTPFPAMTPGTHVLQVEAFNAAGAGISTPLSVTVFVKPGDPANVRIIIGG